MREKEKNNPDIAFGLNLDTEPTKLPQGAYTFALNMAHDSRDGSINSNVNETGNEQCFDIPNGMYLLGHVAMSDGDTLLVLQSDTTGITTLAIHNDICELATIITTDCLAFDSCKQVKGEFKVRNGCERIVTLYDCNGNDKYINIDKLSLYYNIGYIAWLAANPNDTPEDYFIATGLYAWDCNTMRLDPDFKYPDIDFSEITTGGILEVGTYQFSLELLDQDFNVLGYNTFSRRINIFDEAQNAPYYSIDGAYALAANYSLEQGGVTAINKAIRLSISNIATPIFYVRVIVLATIIGDGVTKKCFRKSQYIATSTGTLDYLFKGVSASEGDVEIPVSSITSPKQVYYSSCAQEQVDGRLIRANIKERMVDWIPFQHAASKIVTGWQEIGKTPTTNTSELSVKGGRYYYYRTSYHRDEVIAYAIVFVMKDGTYSPAFHIPGTAANSRVYIDVGFALTCMDNQDIVDDGNANSIAYNHNRNNVPSTTDGDPATELWDKQLIQVVPDSDYPGPYDDDTEVLESNAQHIPMSERTVDNKIERWKLYNTAIKLGGGLLYHPMAYYEATEVYDDIKGCDGTSYWGTDYCGNDLAGTPIRHHKMPDLLMSPHVTDTPLNKYDIGVMFANIEIPAAYIDLVDSYFIVKAEQDFSTETVIDTGLTFDSGINNNADVGLVGAYTPLNTIGAGDDKNKITCYSPKTLFDNTNIPGYIKIEFVVNDTPLTPFPYTLRSWTDYEPLRANATIGADYVKWKYRNVNQSFYLQPNTYVDDGGTILQNNFINIPVLFAELQSDLDAFPLGTATRFFVSFKTWTRPYGNLYNLIYHRIDSKYNTDTESMLSGNSGGDKHIGELTFRKVYLDASVSPSVAKGEVLEGFYMCSTINSELRNHGTLSYQTHWRRFTGTTQEFIQLDAFPDDLDKNYSEDFLVYNEDYNAAINDNSFFPLPITFDFCSECANDYPNRMAYSEKSFEEGNNGDVWKLTKPNNYVDIEARNGAITNIKYDKNVLLILTERSLYAMSPNPQVLNTDASTAYLGTGDFLSLPPNNYVNIDYGYAGCQGRFNAINTPYGWIWADQEKGRVFNYTSGLKEISKQGMYHWFRDNLPSKWMQYMKSKGLDQYVCNDNTSWYYGVGLIAVYDPMYERYILHKKDYELAPNAVWMGIKVPPAPSPVLQAPVFYDVVDGDIMFYTYDYNLAKFNQIYYTDTLYFVSKSWTISYSLIRNTWTGWHSWMPSYVYSNGYNMYSAIHSIDKLWKHGDINFTSYYGVKYDTIIEYVARSLQTQDMECVHWYAQVQLWDDDDQCYYDVDTVTFDKLWAYTRSQSTAKHTLALLDKYTNPFGNIGYSNSVKQVIRTDKNFKVSMLRDLSVDTPIQSSAWLAIKSEFDTPVSSGQGYIDKVVKTANIDTATTNQHRLASLKDKYFYIRLWFSKDNTEDYKLVLDLLNTVTAYSMR